MKRLLIRVLEPIERAARTPSHWWGVATVALAGLLVGLLLLAACQATTAPQEPPPPPDPTSAFVLVSAKISPDSALRLVEPNGGTVDMGGGPVTGAMVVRSSPNLLNQVRGVQITNCFGGWTGGLSVAPNVSAYFLTLSNCLVLSPIVMDRMYNSTIENVWIFGAGVTLTGASYYNRIVNLYAAGDCITFTAASGPSLGANHNQVVGGRCQGTITIGAFVQDIDIHDVAFEGCTGACLKIAGTRIHIGFNRFECASPIGIELEKGSDGWIDAQVWSSCGTRISFNGADPADWHIEAQPPQNVVAP